MIITFLQLFLLLDVFLMGMLAATAVRHAYAHFRPAQHEPEQSSSQAADGHLPPAVKEHLLQASQAHFKAVLDRAAVELQHDLGNTGVQINNLLGQLATEIVGDELERYRAELIQLRKQAEADMGGIRTEIAGHQAELKAKLAQEMAAEKQWLIQQIDTRLADAVGSFLVETLQHNIDLGAQSSYLIAMLEEHKADFVKGVVDEAQVAG